MNDTAILNKAFGKLLAALEGTKHKPCVIGPLAHRDWGIKGDPASIDFLMPAGPEHRQAILGAARGEAYKQPAENALVPAAGSSMHRLFYEDPKTHTTYEANLLEATTPFLQGALKRAKERPILDLLLPVATVEDLIIIRAMAGQPADLAVMTELLRWSAGRIDAPYIKAEADKAGVFDKVKTAWAEAKKQG